MNGTGNFTSNSSFSPQNTSMSLNASSRTFTPSSQIATTTLNESSPVFIPQSISPGGANRLNPNSLTFTPESQWHTAELKGNSPVFQPGEIANPNSSLLGTRELRVDSPAFKPTSETVPLRKDSPVFIPANREAKDLSEPKKDLNVNSRVFVPSNNHSPIQPSDASDLSVDSPSFTPKGIVANGGEELEGDELTQADATEPELDVNSREFLPFGASSGDVGEEEEEDLIEDDLNVDSQEFTPFDALDSSDMPELDVNSSVFVPSGLPTAMPIGLTAERHLGLSDSSDATLAREGEAQDDENGEGEVYEGEEEVYANESDQIEDLPGNFPAMKVDSPVFIPANSETIPMRKDSPVFIPANREAKDLSEPKKDLNVNSRVFVPSNNHSPIQPSDASDLSVDSPSFTPKGIVAIATGGGEEKMKVKSELDVNSRVFIPSNPVRISKDLNVDSAADRTAFEPTATTAHSSPLSLNASSAESKAIVEPNLPLSRQSSIESSAAIRPGVLASGAEALFEENQNLIKMLEKERADTKITLEKFIHRDLALQQDATFLTKELNRTQIEFQKSKVDMHNVRMERDRLLTRIKEMRSDLVDSEKETENLRRQMLKIEKDSAKENAKRMEFLSQAQQELKVMREDYESMKKKLETELSESKSAFEALENEHSMCAKWKFELKTAYSLEKLNVMREKEATDKENADLKISMEKLESEIESLRIDSEELWRDIVEIRDERDQLKREKLEVALYREGFRTTQDDIRSENEALKRELDNFRRERDELRKAQDALRWENEDLKRERNQLREDTCRRNVDPFQHDPDAKKRESRASWRDRLSNILPSDSAMKWRTKMKPSGLFICQVQACDRIFESRESQNPDEALESACSLAYDRLKSSNKPLSGTPDRSDQSLVTASALNTNPSPKSSNPSPILPLGGGSERRKVGSASKSNLSSESRSRGSTAKVYRSPQNPINNSNNSEGPSQAPSRPIVVFSNPTALQSHLRVKKQRLPQESLSSSRISPSNSSRSPNPT